MALYNWPSKFVDEVLLLGADWAAQLGNATIESCDAEAVEGDVVVNQPHATTFTGTVQSVWVSGGSEGRNRIRLTVTLDDGQVLQEDFRIVVQP